jgi:dipeptidyl aminopeptidase/acylaminoacyl peptidase
MRGPDGVTLVLVMRGPLRVGALMICVAVGVTGAHASLVRNPGEIYRVWLDGRRINMSANPADDRFPAVAPDGRRVAFVSDRGLRREGHRTRAHLYVVGGDGGGLRRVSSLLSTEQWLGGQITWSPDSTRLVVSASTSDAFGYHASLYLITPGKRQRVIARAPLIRGPSWSPDGRVIAFHTGAWPNNQTALVTPGGREVLRVKGRSSRRLDGQDEWSATGRIGILRRGRIRIYDSHGRLQMSFVGRSLAWSPDGKRLASVASDRLEVRALSGRLLFRKVVPGLRRGQTNGLVWAAATHVLIGGTGGPLSNRLVDVDTTTGRISNGNNRYFGRLSPDRRHVAEIAYVGEGVALRVSRLDGSDVRVLARRTPCPDLIEADVEWFPDGRSLVYDLKCQP